MRKCRSILLIGVLTWHMAFSQEIGRTNGDDSCGLGTAAMNDEVWDAHIKVPWTAMLYLRTESQPDKLFSGLILSSTMILINANKLFADGDKKLQLFPFSNYEARTNTTTYSEAMTPYMQFSQISHIRIHPTYSGLFKRDDWPISHNNFAIAHLKTPIVFDSQVHPPCIPTNAQLEAILNSWTNLTNSVIVHGWKRHFPESLVLRMAPNNETTCKNYWYGHEETSHANYLDRICANVSTLNSHALCINSGYGVGVFTKLDTRYYFTGLVNNLYSDNRSCTPKTRYFISHATPQVLEWIQQNKKCGPNQFTCTNGDCIPLEGSLCNQTTECADASDEDPIICRGFQYCNVKEFGCGVYGKCIMQNKTCDGQIDCEQGEDEANCPTEAAQSPLLAILLSIFALAILIVTIIAVLFWRKMKLAEEKLRFLTDDEVAEFEHGTLAGATDQSQPLINSKHIYTNSPSSLFQPEKFAWDGLRFEIPKNNLIIDWEDSLGSGISGIVYRGSFQDPKESVKKVPVAVKTFKSTADVESFKTLLSELKIMTRVGSHANVVGLIGAYTREIKQRILYIAVEFCGMGDLEDFLKTNRNSFVPGTVSRNVETTRGGVYEQSRWTSVYINKDVLDEKSRNFGMDDLLRWSYDIANGMEYLASLNITHGDLATRNILLTETFSAKISDFGLSRNLYESGIYVKKQTAPLPWRWMAVESLRDFEFSTHSDVWAYGVTLWEIYSLGGVPFPGLGWTTDFVGKLYDGLRMAKPSYATDEIYHKMLDCWENEPKRRPNFSTLKTLFQNLQDSRKNQGTNL